MNFKGSLIRRFIFQIGNGGRNTIYQFRTLCSAAVFAKNINDRHWKAVIGLEVHAQINAKSKLFSGSEAKFAAPVNSLVSFFDASLPGTLPVLNYRCVEAGVMTALALRSNINLVSTFDRKHYFYADLPAGYQITQQREPLATGGEVVYRGPSGEERIARLVQIQLEQDSGKSLHDAEQGYSLIDLNRAGVGLMEIVTQPDFLSADEATSFVKELQLILQTIDTCDCKMDEGSLRVDASVSIHRSGSPLGVRTEVKNLNSLRALGRAINFEIQRQIKIVESGGEVLNETRAFDVETNTTVGMRDKELLHDYRFMAEPNLPPLRLYDDSSISAKNESVACDQIINIDELRRKQPELPGSKRQRLRSQYGLSEEHSHILVNESGMVECYEQCLREEKRIRNPQTTANFLINDVLHTLNKRKLDFPQSGLNSDQIGQLIDLLQGNDIDLAAAKKVLDTLLDDISRTPAQIVTDLNLSQVKDTDVLMKVCKKVIDENPKIVEAYRQGKTKVLNFLVGQVQRELGGKANAKITTKMLLDMILSPLNK